MSIRVTPLKSNLAFKGISFNDEYGRFSNDFKKEVNENCKSIKGNYIAESQFSGRTSIYKKLCLFGIPLGKKMIDNVETTAKAVINTIKNHK